MGNPVLPSNSQYEIEQNLTSGLLDRGVLIWHILYEKLKLTAMVKHLKQVCGQLPDLRTGKNAIYELADVAMSAFGVFSPNRPPFWPDSAT